MAGKKNPDRIGAKAIENNRSVIVSVPKISGMGNVNEFFRKGQEHNSPRRNKGNTYFQFMSGVADLVR